MRKCGLTLVELTVALALSALLATATLAAAAQMAKGEKQAPSKNEDAQARLKALIEMDIVHGQSWRATKDGLMLQTWACLDGKTREMSHRPVTVMYAVHHIGGRSWLWRRQQGQQTADELVCPDVESVTIQAKARSVGPASNWRALTDEVSVELLPTGQPVRKWTIWR
jgi:prepilin-type N-terminal cleavage/methylation domain-containing protein